MTLTFDDITNIIKLSSYFNVYAKPIDDEQKEEFRSIENSALESLWKIRKELMLDDDFGNPIMEIRKKKRDKDFFNRTNK
jgi:uncharacterized protein YxjI